MEKGANDEFWVEESAEKLHAPVKLKRKVKPKKMEFEGWGSKPIMEFLKSIGKETVNQPSQYELTAIINNYVNQKNLLHPIKKKRVMCDEWLYYLFGKKWVPRIKISDFLEPHFAENNDETEDEESYSSEEQEENEKTTASRKRKAPSLDKNAPQLKQMEKPKSIFSAIIPENMKRVYLRRSLVEELFKDPESFEGKVVGSYVRIKSDPNDYSQKNSHQLLQVTGVRKASECAEGGAEIFLEVPNLIKEVKISMLSDENFSEEECEDLHQRIKAGSFKRPTVVELQEKAQVLHELITKKWLVKELSLLQNLIDRANEKGWRRELFEYLERKQLLQKPSEQERLLCEIPKVIAEDLLDPEATTPRDPPEDVKKEKSSSPSASKTVINGTSADIISSETEANQSLSNQDTATTDSADLKLSELVEERERLVQKKPAKKKRRMVPISMLISKDNEPKATLRDPAELVINQENSFSPNSIISGTSGYISFNTGANQNLSNLNFRGKNASGSGDASIPSRINFGSAFVGGEDDGAYINGITSVKENDGVLSVLEKRNLHLKMENKPDTPVQLQQLPFLAINSKGVIEKFTTPVMIQSVHQAVDTGRKGSEVISQNLSNGGGGEIHVNTEQKKGTQGISQKLTEPHVIELSDDDEQEVQCPGGPYQIVDHPESLIWYYMDPQGSEQGPFSMSSLKRWNDSNYFPAGFMVWKKGHSAVLLEDVIRHMFPN